MCAQSLRPTLQHHGVKPTRLLVRAVFQARVLEGLPFPPPWDLPNPGIKPMSLTSPALAGGFFRASTTWEPQLTEQVQHIICSSSSLPRGQGRTLVYSYRDGNERGPGEPGLSDHILYVPNSCSLYLWAKLHCLSLLKAPCLSQTLGCPFSLPTVWQDS